MTQYDVDVAWLAGFFEGEGTIYAKKGKYLKKSGEVTPNCRISVTICQNFEEPLLKCKKIYSEFSITGPYKNKTSKNIHYQCNVHNEKAMKFIEIIYPLLSERRKIQADKAIDEYISFKKNRELNEQSK